MLSNISTEPTVFSSEQAEIAQKCVTRLVRERRGLLLSLPVGSGKTRIAGIAGVESVRAENPRGTLLVVAPLSLIPQWMRDITLVYDASPLVASKPVVYHWVHDEQHLTTFVKTHADRLKVVLVTPHKLTRCPARPCAWNLMVVDEVHLLSNPETAMYQHLCGIARCRKLGVTATIVSGTRSPEKAFCALAAFVDPAFGAFPTEPRIQHKKYVDSVSTMVLSATADEMGIRKIPQTTQHLFVQFDPDEEERYLTGADAVIAAFELYMGELNSGAATRERIQHCRDCYIHAVEQVRRLTVHSQMSALNKARNHRTNPNDDTYCAAFPLSSAIRGALDFIVTRPRIVVFCAMLAPLDMLRYHLRVQHAITAEIYDGSLSSRTREQLLRRFRAGTLPVLLVSERAGGVGLNLDCACVALFLHAANSPTHEEQLKGRIDRRSQTSPLLEYAVIHLVGSIYQKQRFARRWRVLDQAAAEVTSAAARSDAGRSLTHVEEMQTLAALCRRSMYFADANKWKEFGAAGNVAVQRARYEAYLVQEQEVRGRLHVRETPDAAITAPPTKKRCIDDDATQRPPKKRCIEAKPHRQIIVLK